jgi:two-component system response regulator MprA
VRVLVVDDEPVLLVSLARSLRFEGYEVVTAGNGVEALGHLSVVRPDVVVLDVVMPRLDGIEVCRRIRDAGDRTPVLMLTARDAVRDRVRGLDVGADDYLVKPFAHEELLARG